MATTPPWPRPPLPQLEFRVADADAPVSGPAVGDTALAFSAADLQAGCRAGDARTHRGSRGPNPGLPDAAVQTARVPFPFFIPLHLQRIFP